MKLLSIPFSHFCEKARWALDLSQQKYTEDPHLPMFHYLNNKLHQAPGETVPVLILDSGESITDSTAILQYLNRTFDLGLYPEQRQTLEWEERFDDVLGVEARRWAYARLLQHDDLFREILDGFHHLEVPLAKSALFFFKPLIRKKAQISKGSVAYSLQRIDALWQELDAHFETHHYLVGAQFSAADLTLAALGGILVFPKEYGYAFPPVSRLPLGMRQEVERYSQSPTGQAILRLYREHRWT